MNKKTFWGVATLIILLVGVISFVMLTRTTELGIIVNDVPEETLDNIRKEINSQILSTQKPPDEPGFVWEWHGDHWHKMPIAETEKPVVDVPKEQEIKLYTGPLTYHEELLETNPLKALILQSEERGHWSAKWIAEIPPDDLEAQAIAKTMYLRMYYNTLYRTTGKIPISDAEYHQLGEEFNAALDYIREIPVIDGVDRRTVLFTVTYPFTTYPEPVQSSPFVNRNN